MPNQDEMLLPSLKDQLGLIEDPFSARINAFYEGAQRRHNLETLRHLSVFGDMVLLLTGDRGSGKTALIDQFSKNFAGEIDLLRLAAGEGSERINSIVRLAAISGLEISAKDPIRDVLEHLIDKYADSFDNSGRRTLVVIDDAHALPAEELLTYLQVMGSLDPESGAVLALVGLPKLMHDVMAYEHPDRADWVHQIQLKPLSVEDTQEYLLCRLEAAGYVGDVPLNPDQLEQLHVLAKGMPGLVSESFSAILLGTAEPSAINNSEGARVAQYALYAISLLLVLSFAFVSYQHGFFELQDSEQELSRTPLMDEEAQKASRLARIEKAIAESSISQNTDVEKDAGSLTALSSGLESKSDMASSSVGGSDSVANQPQSELNESAGKEVESSANQEDAESVSALVPIDKAKAEISDQLSVVVADAADVVSAPKAVASSLVAVEPKVYAPKVVRKIEVKKERLVEDGSIYRSQEWVLAQADVAYTAQVLGSYNEQTAKQFVQRNKGSAPQLYYVKTKYKGRDWFVVLYGAFDSKSLAQRALKQSANAVQAQKPWLRSFSGIKNSFAK